MSHRSSVLLHGCSDSLSLHLALLLPLHREAVGGLIDRDVSLLLDHSPCIKEKRASSPSRHNLEFRIEVPHWPTLTDRPVLIKPSQPAVTATGDGNPRARKPLSWEGLKMQTRLLAAAVLCALFSVNAGAHVGVTIEFPNVPNSASEVSEDKGAKQIVSQLRSWVNAPSLNRFSGLWLLNYAPGWPTPRGTSDAARPRRSCTTSHSVCWPDFRGHRLRY